MPQLETVGQHTNTINENFFRSLWNNFMGLSSVTKSAVVVILLLVVATPIIIKSSFLAKQNASGATVTVSNSPIGTIQTQLSTNIVTWASDFSQIPNGQADLTNLQAPLVRLHVGDDGGPAMPEINQGSWDMTTINNMVNDVFNTGQQPLLNIKFAPDWMWTCYPNSIGASANGTQGTGTVKDLTFQTFAQYMARLVSYYNKGSLTEENGTVLQNPSGTNHKITYWELWNEPDLNIETPCAPANGVGLTESQYVTMWNAVTAAMLAVDPTIKFVGPAAANAYVGTSSTTGNSYIDALMSGATVKPSAISFHNYGYWQNNVADKIFFDGEGNGNGGQGITDMVTEVGAIHKYYPTLPVFLTEVNVNADWGAKGQNDDELSAAWWGASVAQLAPLGVATINQYDFTGDNIFGLINGESNPTGKPTLPYYAFQQMDKAFPQGSTIISSTSIQPGILSLAVQKPDGTYSVMIVNRELLSNTASSTCGTGGVATTVTVDVSALNPSSITETQVDKNNIDCSTWYGIAPTTNTVPTAQPVSITFPGYGIAILNITSNGQSTPTPTDVFQPSATPTVLPTATTAPGLPTPTPVASTYTMSGSVYIDANQNGKKDNGEVYYTLGAQVALSGALSANQVTNSVGKYTFSNLVNGIYTATLTVPSGYKATTATAKTKTVAGANITGVNFGIAPVSGPTATPIPTTALPSPTPTPISTSGTNLVIYDNAVSSLFTDNTFNYSAKNACDSSTFVSSPCSYAATFQPYGAYEFIYKNGSISPTLYKSLDLDININGQIITNFGAFLTTSSGALINEIFFSSSNVTKNYGNGWVHVSIPMSQIDPKNTLFHYVDIENAKNTSISQIHVDNVELVGL